MAIEKLAEAASNQTDEQTNILNAAVESAKQKLEQAQVRLADHLEKHKELDSEQVK
jgi:hypothetical protein